MVPQDKGGDKIAASNRAGKTGRVDRVHLAKYFNDVVNDDHRADDRVTVPRSVVNPLQLTRKMFGDDYSMYMICKAQPHRQGVDMMSYADYFYALIGSVHPD